MKLPIIAFLLSIFCFSINLKAERYTLGIAVSPHILEVFNQWTLKQDCWNVDEFKSKHSSRGAIELVIICKALHLGGLDVRLDFYPSPNYTRSLVLANQRKVHIPGETIWKDEIDESIFYVSKPVIDVGEMKKGIFTLGNHPMLDVVKTKQDLQKYVGISPNKWTHDWQVISKLTPQLLNAPSSTAVHKMIAKGRADFTLGEFNSDMKIGLENVVLVPIPNMYVSLAQSRHFIVRKDVRNSKLIFLALEKGLSILKENKFINKAYTASGFTPAEIANWQDISVDLE
ncbi:hypothetical protein Q4575_08215 [Psychrosphaera sp. 1_MG-2023]|uniref:hypothetical protein n=1 Tax=Psychrosphaera sp. 1_MG-2023 TaxID=3062643 RepID=UPI0026E11564|nr:hypothetical protein [Psychrosphaera sp. 1_MG-2023]MDO6719380.1 hypothetical protein [Psychrosphaera sp. 1_MG-2023]